MKKKKKILKNENKFILIRYNGISNKFKANGIISGKIYVWEQKFGENSILKVDIRDAKHILSIQGRDKKPLLEIIQ